jgi:hypothetical protein
MRDLDHIFDIYRNSRQMPDDKFKSSWHLVLGADSFCMYRSE